MELIIEIVKFFVFAFAIVIISKYFLVPILRKISEEFGLEERIIGNITGFATSVPELLTVVFSASSGLVDTGIYNIISSNIINLVQYLFAIYINKKQKYLSNKAIKIDIFIVIITIVLPILLVKTKIELSLVITIIFILLFVLFYYINKNLHKLYLKIQDEEIENLYKDKKQGKNIIKVIINIILLLGVCVLLYIIGELLTNTLKNLNGNFNLPELLLGVLIGFITSIPELITFFEALSIEKKQKIEDKEIGIVEATNNLLISNLLNLFIIQSIGILIYNIFGR